MIISYQPELRPALPNVYAASDYREFRDQLSTIDELLVKSGLESSLIEGALQRWEKDMLKDKREVSAAQRQRQYRISHYALRCNIARHLVGESYRAFSIRLGDSNLLQWFTGISAFEHAKAASKSSLERYDKFFELEEVEAQIRGLLGVSKYPGRFWPIAWNNPGGTHGAGVR
jgi:hypothetical protein